MAETLTLKAHWLLTRAPESYANYHGECLDSLLAYCSTVLNELNRVKASHLSEGFLDVLKDFSPPFRKEKLSLKTKFAQVRTRDKEDNLIREWSVSRTVKNSGFSAVRM